MATNEKDRSPGSITNDPDVENSEQNEAGTQAQDLAEEALHPEEVLGRSSAESESGYDQADDDLVPRDVPDLVDTMNDMVQSGRIDRSAFAGEDEMDDEEEDDDGEDEEE
ncbi:MAG: hypothetical protein J7496_03410 [Novosphingobium sp.]|nr:hypothetical protein [Novosphingobium sp.]MBO9601539.1 hypothetical protein [Novosphingobium sp.]